MTENEINLLLRAAQYAKLNPSELKAVNPFTQQGNTAKTMQLAVDALDPVQAAKWRVESGQSASLEATAARAGLLEMNQRTHAELMELDGDYRTGVEESKSRREAELLAAMDAEASRLAEAREKKQAQFRHSAGNSNTGEHTRDFYRRLGIQNAAQLKNMPTRRLTGK